MSVSQNFTNMSAAIVQVLQGVQVNDVAVFAQVLPYPSLNFTGSPSVTVAPSDNASDYATNVQNLRSYGWHVDIYAPIEETNAGYAVVFPQMMALVDSALDAFDNSNSLNGTCQILVPTPSNWSLAQTNLGVCLQAKIILHAKQTVNQDNG
jgi:hypothetical protein